MKKFICGALSVVLAASCLTACSKKNETGQGTDGEPVGTVTDFEMGEAEVHESILPWQFDEGEAVENIYYKRTTDENGTNVYAVRKASDNQVAYLPMGNTVVYVGDSEDCYFERTTNTYKLDGEDSTTVQFQLYVTNGIVAPETPAAGMDDAAGEDDSTEPGAITVEIPASGSAEVDVNAPDIIVAPPEVSRDWREDGRQEPDEGSVMIIPGDGLAAGGDASDDAGDLSVNVGSMAR